MSPAAPVTVQPSWVQTASMAEKLLAPVRATRNLPPVDCTSTAPPTSASAEPAVVTCTLDPASRPFNTPRSVALLPSEVGEPPPHADINVAIVAQEAT